MNQSTSFRCLTTLLLGLALGFNARAATIIKAATGTDLTQGASWGGTAPGAADTAAWLGNSLGVGLTLGSPAAWGGISVGSAASNIAITGSGTLSLGGGGINLSTANVSFALGAPVILEARQTWNINYSKQLTCSGSISGSFALTNSGGGTLSLTAANTFTGGMTVNGGTLALDYANPGDQPTGVLAANSTLTVNTGAILRLDYEDELGFYGGSLAQLNLNGGLVTSAGVANPTPVQSGGASFRVTLPTLNFSGGTLSSGSNNQGDAFGGCYLVSNLNTFSNSTPVGINAYSISIQNSTFNVAAGNTPSGVDLSVSSILVNWVSGAQSLTKTGNGRMVLSNACTYSGVTTISAGTLALAGNGSIASSPVIILGSGAVLDVSGLAAPFLLGSSQTLSNLTGTAVLKGSAGTGFGTVALNYVAGTPSLAVTNGTLTLSPGTVFQINNTGSALAAGAYKIIAKKSGGVVTGALPPVIVTGGGIGPGMVASLQLTSGELYLMVAGAGGFSVNGGALQTGVLTGQGYGNDTVTAQGGFTGSYSQNPGNIYCAENINLLAGADIFSPNRQPFITNGVSSFTTNIVTYAIADYHQAVVAFIHGNFTNLGTLTYTNNSLPSSTVLIGFDSFPAPEPPLPNTNQLYYFGEGVFVDVGNVQYGGPATIVNGSPANPNAAIDSVITGSGQENAEGVHAEAYYSNLPRTPDLTFLNYGEVSGSSQRCANGTALAYHGYTLYGGQTVSNGPTAIATALAPYYTTALYAFSYYGDVNMSQAGQATAISTGGQQGNAAGLGLAVGMDAYSYNGQINLYNSGTITGVASATTNANANAVFAWSENDDSTVTGGFTFINTGTISATATPAAGSANASASPLYGGCNGGPVNLVNTGTVIGNAPNGGWGWGTENDSGNPISIYNSGSIAHNTGLGVFIYGTDGGTAVITNTGSGSIFGGNEGIAAENYTGNLTIYNYGTVMGGSVNNNAMDLGHGNDTVHLYGLPNIVGWMNGQGGSNVLDFELVGTLQQVNGAPPVQSTNLAAYKFSPTAGNSIVVSGRTYKWSNFYVAGSVSPSPSLTINLASGGKSLHLAWPPASLGWQLQYQTNFSQAGLGTHWQNVAGSTGTNQMEVPLTLTNGCVFYRLSLE